MVIKQKKMTKKSTVPKRAEKKKVGRPKTTTKVAKDTTEAGTLPGEKRATFIVKAEQLEKVKAMAYWGRVNIKDVMDAALEKYIAAWEKKHGPVRTKPRSRKAGTRQQKA